MTIIALIMTVILSVHLIYSMLEFWLGYKSIKNLTCQTSLPPSQLPSVSIIFSALNEEENLAQALTTMLNLDYPQLEIIAINDRSSDQTGSILENFSKKFFNLRVIHIKKLSDNWLGKNHAMYLGAKKASGEWLLFTDADVLMDRQLLMKAMSYVIEQRIDHLTIYEKHLSKPFGLKILLLGSYAMYCYFLKPWRIRYKWSKKHLGHGAFNLVNKQAYQQAGTYRAIAMECLDDIRLGKLLKDGGFQQDIVKGHDYIQREWYSSLSAMIHGFSKNSYAYVDYNFQAMLLGVIFIFFYYFWPFMAVLFFSGPIFWINLLNIVLAFCFSILIAKQFHLSKMYAVFYPLSIILIIYTTIYSAFLTCKNNGIYWRGTHYSLKKLHNKPSPADTIDN